MLPGDEELVERLYRVLGMRSSTTFNGALVGLVCRQDIKRIIEVLKAQGYDPGDPLYRDANGDKLLLNARVGYHEKGEFEGSYGVVVGLGDGQGNDVVTIRLDQVTYAIETTPANLMLV